MNIIIDLLFMLMKLYWVKRSKFKHVEDNNINLVVKLLKFMCINTWLYKKILF